MHNWAVPTTNEAYLDEIKSTHTVEQLPMISIEISLPPLIMKKNSQAPSLESSSIAHFNIKQKHIFNAYVKDSLLFDLPHPSLPPV